MPDPDLNQKQPLIARLAFYYLVIFSCLVIGFGVSYLQLPPYHQIDNGLKELGAFLKGKAGENKSTMERLTLHRQERREKLFEPGFHLRDPNFVDPGYLLISEFNKGEDQVVVRLVSVDGFKEVYRWVPPVEEIIERTFQDVGCNNKAGYEAQHPLLHDDGSLVFTSGEGPLVKIDRNNNIVWTVTGYFHHSIERDSKGNYVVPTVNNPPFMSFNIDGTHYRDDAYAVVSPDGELLEIQSIGKLLVQDDRFVGAFLGVGNFNMDRIHLNDAQPILEDNGTALKGDIVFSIRHLSLVMLYRPSIGKIIWGRIGPWTYQHDVNILPDGRFSIFSNNVMTLRDDNDAVPHKPYSEVYIYDPTTDLVESPYREEMEKIGCLTVTAGRSRILPNGDVYLEQSDFCHLVRISRDSIRWEYTNQLTADTQGLVNWCRYLLPEEVNLDWLNESQN